MKPIRFLIAALAVAGLTACYTSTKPLISDDEGTTPFAKMTFTNTGEANAKPAVFVKDGKSYLSHSDDGDVRLHLKPVEGNDYVAQMSTTGDAGAVPQILYGYMRMDAPGQKADLWMIFGDKTGVRPGLSLCNDVLCIDDLNAYVTYAKEAIAKGEPASMSLKFETE